ncbi:hypothetical protein EV356DRAFT_496334 [Viridothelium virens]|uniref:Uncharacterized protein n=1 Tax=Viridothelium virens TaxID=1048519 RepID=A0A6A6GVA4_VIRVR|nr:hypothetical protein EV356DRAFT_496334 [Viridothelium virens]
MKDAEPKQGLTYDFRAATAGLANVLVAVSFYSDPRKRLLRIWKPPRPLQARKTGPEYSLHMLPGRRLRGTRLCEYHFPECRRCHAEDFPKQYLRACPRLELPM